MRSFVELNQTARAHPPRIACQTRSAEFILQIAETTVPQLEQEHSAATLLLGAVKVEQITQQDTDHPRAYHLQA